MANDAEVIKSLREEIERLRMALDRSARQHHDTLTASKLHAPEHTSFEECPALTCAHARNHINRAAS